MRQQIARWTGAAAVALAVLVGGNLAGAADVAQAAPLAGVSAQYGDLTPGGVQTLGGPGYAHGYGDTYGTYAASPSYGGYSPTPWYNQPFAPTTPVQQTNTPVQYYHQFHPGAAYSCPGVFPC